MPGTRWFGHVDMAASYPSEPVVLEELERVLDAARPANIDPVRSNAVDGSLSSPTPSASSGTSRLRSRRTWADLKRAWSSTGRFGLASSGPDGSERPLRSLTRSSAITTTLIGPSGGTRSSHRRQHPRPDQANSITLESPAHPRPVPIPRPSPARLRLQPPLGPLPRLPVESVSR